MEASVVRRRPWIDDRGIADDDDDEMAFFDVADGRDIDSGKAVM